MKNCLNGEPVKQPILIASFVCIVATLCLPGPAAAQDEQPAQEIVPTVILVTMQAGSSSEAWAEAEKKIEQEFKILNLRVKVVESHAVSERDRRIELGALAGKYRAAAAVRIIRSAENETAGVDLWIADRVTGKTTFRHLGLGETQGAEAAAVAALRTVELLRSSLLELRDPTNERQTVPVPEEIEALLPENIDEKHEDIFFGIGISAAGSPGGVGLLGSVYVTGGWLPVARFSLALEGTVSVIGEDLEKDAVGSSFDFAKVNVWGGWEILDSGLFRPSLGVGGGVVFCWARGFGDGQADTTTARLVSGVLGARGQLGLAISEYLWLRAGVEVGLLIPQPTINFGGEKVASFGAPLIEGVLGVEMHFH